MTRTLTETRSCESESAPWLVITVDTEEDGLWQGRYPRQHTSVENLRGLPRFQAFCEKLGIRPTYLIDWPVVECSWAVEWLAAWQEAGQCEVGAHLHPWCNPPFHEECNDYNSYLCNLPSELQYEKLRQLTEAIQRRFGRRPRSFRAGRYGLDAAGARMLAELGYLVDSSVTPFVDWSSDGGPDFRHAPWRPYRPAADELCQPSENGRLWEVPVLSGYNVHDFEKASRHWQKLARLPCRVFRILGILDQLGVLQQIRFSPEKANARRMKKLVDASVTQDSECLVMIFHSSSLTPGHSPYVRDARQLDAFYERIDATFAHCYHHYRTPCGTLTGVVENVLMPRGKDDVVL